MRTRKLPSHVRTLGRAIRAGERQPIHSLRMAQSIARLAELARQPRVVHAYTHAHIAGPPDKTYVKRIVQTDFTQIEARMLAHMESQK